MAKRFQFRLETVRKLRRRAQDAQSRVVAQAAGALASAKRQREDIETRLSQSACDTRDVQTAGALDLNQVRAHQIHRGWLQRELRDTTAELTLRQQTLDAERVKLAGAAKHRKVIEKLHDRRRAYHGDAVRREEQGLTDEAAGQMFLRTHRSDDGGPRS